jgi:ABC-type Fe3+ transport system substrate-binding protein
MENGIDRSASRRAVLRLLGLGAGAALLEGWRLADALAAAPVAASPVDRAIEWARVNLPNSTPEIVRGAAKEGKLALTLQQLSDDAPQAMIRKFNEHYPFIAVTYTSQTSAQLISKFNAELSARRGISDYLQLPSNLKETAAFEKQGAFLRFTISQDSAYSAKTKHSGIWYAWLRQHGVTAYRRGALSDAEKKLIRSSAGLGDPRFKGRIGINNVNNSVAVTGTYVLLYESDPKLWQGLVANRPKVKPSSASLMDGLLSGEYDVALFCGFSTAANAAQEGAPVEFGVTAPAAVTYVPGAISALAPNPNAARQDWAMSREGQEIWSSMAGTFPARTGVTGKSWAENQPWYFEDRLTHKDIDWDAFTARQPEVADRFKKDLQSG